MYMHVPTHSQIGTAATDTPYEALRTWGRIVRLNADMMNQKANA